MNDEYPMFSLFPIKLSPEAGVFPVAKIKENTVLKNRLFYRDKREPPLKAEGIADGVKQVIAVRGVVVLKHVVIEHNAYIPFDERYAYTASHENGRDQFGRAVFAVHFSPAFIEFRLQAESQEWKWIDFTENIEPHIIHLIVRFGSIVMIVSNPATYGKIRALGVSHLRGDAQGGLPVAEGHAERTAEQPFSLPGFELGSGSILSESRCPDLSKLPGTEGIVACRPGFRLKQAEE